MELKLKMNLLKLLGMGLFAGVLFVVLIFGDNLGVFGTVFILAMLGIFLVGAKDAEILDIKRGRLMLGSIVLLALSFTLHSPKALWLTNVLVIILLCLLYSIHMIDKSEFKVEPMWIVKIFESIVFPIAEIEKPFLLIRDT